MNLTYASLAIGVLATGAVAFTASNPNRRAFLSQTVATASAALIAVPKISIADDDTTDYITTESGLKYKVLKEGIGAVPEPGMSVKAH
jgi:FKBP-type peptidyl-prolyl cis-trans isomerase